MAEYQADAAGRDGEDQAVLRRYDAGPQIHNLRIRLKGRKLFVHPSPDGMIHLKYAEGSGDFCSVSEEGADTLVVEVRGEESGRVLIVELPEGGLSNLEILSQDAAVDLPQINVSERLSVHAVSGDIVAGELNAGEEISLKAENGDVTGIKLNAGQRLSILAEEGDILWNRINAGQEIDLRVEDGDVMGIEWIAGQSISAIAQAGDMEWVRLGAGREVSLKAMAGDIQWIHLNAGQEINLEAEVGDITGALEGGYDDYDITAQVKEGDSNLPERKEGGTKKLNVYVNNGDIRIKLEPGN